MLSQDKLNIETVCVLGKLLLIEDSIEAPSSGITHTHGNRRMAQFRMPVTNTFK